MNFSVLFPLADFSLHPVVVREDTLYGIVFVNLLRPNLWPDIQPILEHGQCALEKDVYSVVV